MLIAVKRPAIVTVVVGLALAGCSSSGDLQTLFDGKRGDIEVGSAVEAAIRERIAVAQPRLDAVEKEPGFLKWKTWTMPTGSMEDTILIGDAILASRFETLTLNVENGDLLVFEYPIDREEQFIKRVIGIPGDRLRLVDKQLFRNGEKVEEAYAVHKTAYTIDYRDNFPAAPDPQAYPPADEMLEKYVEGDELLVPEGHFFMMGDNRDLSLDSRYWGYLPQALIIGRVEAIYWSADTPSSLFGEEVKSTPRLERVGVMPR